jgi:aryl-alcohol dehydrogenase-like predicted oxidoreductase
LKRREFLAGSALGLGAVWFGAKSFGPRAAARPLPIPAGVRFSASDTVTLGSTGIKTSRLAMGTGTVGYGHHSNQTALGMKGLPDLLQNGYDHGLRFFDLADSYGSHPFAAEALKHIPREKVTLLTKSDNRDAAGMKGDIERFRKELNTDYLDIVLMHCMTEGDWTTRFRPVMDVLEEAREKGIIRAHGCSCHTIEALRAAAKSPWVQVDLARVNPIGSHMDAHPDTVVSVLREMRAAGKAVIGMKILGQGDMRLRQDEALKYSLSLDVLHAFTIGAESRHEQEDLLRRIAAVNA